MKLKLDLTIVAILGSLALGLLLPLDGQAAEVLDVVTKVAIFLLFFGYGAKLSGGGRGGNMIALVSEERLEAVRDALLAAGARRAFAARILPAVEG